MSKDDLQSKNNELKKETHVHNHEHKNEGTNEECCVESSHEHKHKLGDKKGGACSSCGCCSAGAKKSENKYIAWIILGISLVSLIVSFLAPLEHSKTFMRYIDFGWIAVILCGYGIFVEAFKSLAKGKITSGLLISVSIIACIVLEILTLIGFLPSDGHGHGNIFAAGEVALLMFLGELIEEITVNKARSGISKLVELAPTTAKYRVGNDLIEKPLSEVKIGDIVVVLPNDIISVDGKIVSGQTAIDESVMTGESVPVDKKEGDIVFGGTQNKTGALEIQVLKSSNEMAVSKLRELVEEAEGKKAPISRLADKWSKVIVPSAMILAVVIFLLTFFVFTNRDIYIAIMRGVTMLVVFCPCALALATPTSIAAGLGAGARRGVLIKSGAALEELARVQTVAFDKTGTLTTGALVVDDIICYNTTLSHLAAIAGATERLSEHPIAKAITKHCELVSELPLAKGTTSLLGKGVESIIDNKKVVCAKIEYLEEIGVNKDIAKADLEKYFSLGKTVVAVVEEGELLGIIALSDQVKDGAKEMLSALHDKNINTIMLTGDNKFVAYSVAIKTGINETFYSLMPEDKMNKIKELQNSGKKICMVGDGVNDAPALATANCSIAMGALGSDVAIETADIAIMNSDISNVSGVVKYSKKVLNTIKVNIALSLAINVLAVILNLLGYLNPVTGALIHNCSSIIVVLNSAFLLCRWKSNKKAKVLQNTKQQLV